tara:strand:+ start:269 stop:829 length:561 start_codon:yes stop_codon:yes gene_type:complete
MKKYFSLFIVIFFSTQIYSQTPLEIVAWINDFENNYATERILDRTTIDKVVLSYKKLSGKDILIVRTHSYNGTSNPPIIDTYIDLSKVVRISAEPTIRGNDAFCDVKICTSEDGIGIILKMPDSDKWVTFPGEKEFLEKQGYCNSEIRLSLYDRAADAEKLLERITNALVTLSKMYGSNPAIGPLF